MVITNEIFLILAALSIFANISQLQISLSSEFRSPLSSPFGELGEPIPGEFIITLKNNSLPIGEPISMTVENESAVSISKKYLEEKEQIVLHTYDDGLAVKIPPNLTRSSTSSLGSIMPSETTSIDILSIYAPNANVSDITSINVLNQSIQQENDLDVGITTSLSVPAQNVTLLWTTKVNDTIAEMLGTPSIEIVAPGINTTLKSIIVFNAFIPKKMADIDRNQIINNIASLSIPAQNVTLLGTTKVNNTIAALISIPKQNANISFSNNTNLTPQEIIIPPQNVTLLAVSNTKKLIENSTQICEIIKLNSAVESCIPNLPLGLSSIEDINSTQQITTGLSRIEENIAFYDLNDRNVTIAIVDSGVNPHPDLNVIGEKSCMQNNNTRDDLNHGTHVAGIAAAKNNSIGIVGVAPDANIFSIKVKGIDPITKKPIGSLAEIKCALEFINKNTEWIDVVNLSIYAIPVNFSPVIISATFKDLVETIKETIAKNVTFVGAAGNFQMDAKKIWPGVDDNMIIVGSISDSDGKCGKNGSDVKIWDNNKKPPGFIIENGEFLTDKDDSFATSYSNVGDGVDIVAPGTNILSTSNNGSYNINTGTSFASPYVAGAAALIISSHPEITPFEVRNLLLNTGWNASDNFCYYTINNSNEPKVPLLHLTPLIQNFTH
jgi:subtilisin family serine protease